MTFSIEATVSGKIGFASHQNSAPVVRELTLRNGGGVAIEGCRLILRADPPFLTEKSWRIDRISPQDEIVILDRDVHLNGTLLSGLTEAMTACAILTLLDSADQELASVCQPVELLAHNEWGGVGTMADLIPAFVMPNDPAVDQVLKAASDCLRRTGSPTRSMDTKAVNGPVYGSSPRRYGRLWRGFDSPTPCRQQVSSAADRRSGHRPRFWMAGWPPASTRPCSSPPPWSRRASIPW
ncbi:hypothetical protein [Hankyongella ginsenosidimutans]|uniref:hypothetical protein n=1 Tax=Hankyongella ginsenosidimutans TaxID=1763828 RepID=UPI001FE2CA4F|nr:hypothetical protein [Hankyongella ginsenosidimutans]